MNMKAFSEILREITGGVNPIMTVKEIASVTRVHEQTVYSWKNDNTEPGYSKIMDLSCHLIKEHGYWELAFQFFAVCTGQADGEVTDNTRKIIEACVDINRSFPDNLIACTNALGVVKTEHDIVHEEIKKAS